VRCDRTGGKRDGGVALYVSSTLKIKILATSEVVYYGKPEFIIAEFTAEPDKLLLATVYRSPKIGFLQEFENILLDLFTGYSNLAIFGDFNANLCTSIVDTSRSSSTPQTCTLYPIIPIIWRTHPHSSIFVRWTSRTNLSALDKRTFPSCQPILSILSTTLASPEVLPDQPGRMISEVSIVTDFLGPL